MARSAGFAPALVAAALCVVACPGLAESAERSASTRTAAPAPMSDRQTALLRVTFAEGTALENAGRWADALAKFEAVARLRRTPQVQFHIGLCHEHLGRLRQAQAWYLAAYAAAATGSAVEAEAVERFGELSARLPRVVLQLSGDGDGVVIELDGAIVKTGAPLVVDPGPHVAVARRRGVPIAAVAFSAHERRSHPITLRAIDRSGAVAQPAAGRESPIARATPSR